MEKKLDSSLVYDGWLLKVYRDRVLIEKNGNESFREYTLHPGGVCIAALDEQRRLWFVKQYRYALGRDVVELPAGKLEWGENPDDAAVRELSEETGFTADRMVKLSENYPSPGYTAEILHLYFAEGLHGGEQHLDEDEELVCFPIPLGEAVEMVRRGELPDGKTQSLILMVNDIVTRREQNK